MTNTVKTIKQVFRSMLEDATHETIGVNPISFRQIKHRVKKLGKYPSLDKICIYLERAWYEVTGDFRIVKTY